MSNTVLEKFKATVAAANTAVTKSIQKITALNSQVAAHAQATKVASDRATQAESDLAALRTSKATVDSQLATAQASVTDLTAKLTAAESRAKAAESELSSISALTDDLNKAIANLGA